MRKAIAIFLLVFLPLQWGWAVAASYCEHEADASNAHYGHHEHKHVHADASAAGEAGTDEGTSAEEADVYAGGHADCGMCQLSSASAVIPRLAVAVQTSSDTLPESASVLWSDGHPESLYRPPLPSAA